MSNPDAAAVPAATPPIPDGATPARLRGLFAHLGDGVLLGLQGGGILEANPAACALLGLSEREIIERGREGILDLEAPGARQAFEEYRRSGRFRGHVLLIDGRGRRLPAELAAQDFTGEDGVGYTSVLLRDVRSSRVAHATQRTRGILQAVTDAIVIVDAEGVITYVNAAAEKVLGVPASAVLGRTHHDDRWKISGPDGSDFLAEELPFTRVRRTGEPVYDVKHGIEHPDGRRVVLSINAAPFADPDGGFGGIVAAVRDVTRAQQEQQRLAQYEAIVASSPDAMVAMDWNGAIISWNEAAREMFGYEAEEILGRHVSVLVPAELQGELEELRATLLRGIPRCSIETLRRRRDGSTFPASVSIAPMRSRSGAVVGAAAIVRDTTERRAAEDRLRFQASLLDSVQEAVAAIDADGHYVYLNDRARELFGWEPEWILGRHFREVVTRGFPPQVPGLIERCLAGDAWVGEVTVRDIDDRELPALLTLAPIHDDGGRVIGTVGLLADLRQVRSLEQQLGHAQKMEAIGRLAGGVAHDFNNVLTAIQGHAQLALEAVPAGGRIGEDIQEILRSAERATTLTRHLLAFSRRQVLQPRVVEVGEVIHGMDRMLRRLIGEDVELVNECPERVGCVLVDPVQLEQVILNLVMNARDAMPAGGRINVHAVVSPAAPPGAPERPADASPHVVVSVHDTGSGIPREIQERIFEPFFTTKGPGKGSGLGLSTVYGIVHQSGGFITMSSTEGEGSSFSVHLPRVDAPSAPPAAAAVVQAVVDGTETVLLVEDEETVRRLARRILQMRGYRVLEAEDGIAALQLALSSERGMDVLVSDIVMPRMNGLELVAALRASRPGLPVVLMSGYSEEVVEQRGLLPDDAVFLAKPFTPNALAVAVRDALAAGAAPPLDA